jgi:DNA-binding winged helix-turn-helix (wHTH) protein
MADARRLDSFRSYILAGKGEDDIRRRALDVLDELMEERSSAEPVIAEADKDLIEFPVSWKLSVRHVRLLSALFRSEKFISAQELDDIVYRDEPRRSKKSGLAPIKVMASTVRLKLQDVGIQHAIVNVYGAGYWLTPDGRASIARLIEEDIGRTRSSAAEALRRIAGQP